MLAFTPHAAVLDPPNPLPQKKTQEEENSLLSIPSSSLPQKNIREAGNLSSKENPSRIAEKDNNLLRATKEKSSIEEDKAPSRNTRKESNLSLNTEEEKPTSNRVATHDWAAILPQLNLTGLAQTVASHCSIINISAEQIDLVLDSGQAALLNPKLSKRIEAAIQEYFAQPMTVTIQVANAPTRSPAGSKLLVKEKRYMQATQAITEDNNVQSLLKVFNARVQPNSIHPIVVPSTDESQLKTYGDKF
jgi:hypothetical protein